MARTKRKGLEWDFSAVIEDIGMEKLIELLGFKQVMEAIGPARILESKGVKWFLSKLTPEQRKKLKEELK